MNPVTLIGSILLAIGTIASGLLLVSSAGVVPLAGSLGLWLMFLTGVTLGASTLLFAPQKAGGQALRIAGGVTMLVSLGAMGLQMATYAGFGALSQVSALGLWPLAITTFFVAITELLSGYLLTRAPEARM
jgi:hypothetical protein